MELSCHFIQIQTGDYRSSRPGAFFRKNVLRNFAKFTEKHLFQSLFFNKVAGLEPATFKKETLAQVFFCEFCEISKSTFFKEHLWTTVSVYDRCALSVALFNLLQSRLTFLYPLKTSENL